MIQLSALGARRRRAVAIICVATLAAFGCARDSSILMTQPPSTDDAASALADKFDTALARYAARVIVSDVDLDDPDAVRTLTLSHMAREFGVDSKEYEATVVSLEAASHGALPADPTFYLSELPSVRLRRVVQDVERLRLTSPTLEDFTAGVALRLAAVRAASGIGEGLSEEERAWATVYLAGYRTAVSVLVPLLIDRKAEGVLNRFSPWRCAAGVLGGALMGGITGAGIGTAITPGVGTAVGAGVGFVGGALTGAATFCASVDAAPTGRGMGEVNSVAAACA